MHTSFRSLALASLFIAATIIPSIAHAQVTIGISSFGLVTANNSKLADEFTDGWLETTVGSYAADAVIPITGGTATMASAISNSSFDAVNEIVMFNGALIADAGEDPGGFLSSATSTVENTFDLNLDSAREFSFTGSEFLAGNGSGSIFLRNSDSSIIHFLGSSGTLAAGTWTIETMHSVESLSAPPAIGPVSTASYNSTLELFSVAVPEPSSLLVVIAFGGFALARRKR